MNYSVNILFNFKILGRIIRVDHVNDYKPPKDEDELEEERKKRDFKKRNYDGPRDRDFKRRDDDGSRDFKKRDNDGSRDFKRRDDSSRDRDYKRRDDGGNHDFKKPLDRR